MIVVVSVRGTKLLAVDPVTRRYVVNVPMQFTFDPATGALEPLDRARYIDDPVVIEVDRWLF